MDDGVRAHFNHMSAYIGIDPIGEPHARYKIVSKLDWAGTLKTLEQLGGKWCPDLYYGYSVLHHCLEPMMKTEYTPLTDAEREALMSKAYETNIVGNEQTDADAQSYVGE